MSPWLSHTTVAALICAVCCCGNAFAQNVSCAPREPRPSLIRIEQRPPFAPGSGVVIVRRDQFAVVLTVRHVLDSLADFSVSFQAAPGRRFPVRFDDDTVLAVSAESELVVFRVDGAIPDGVVPEDPFTRDLPDGAAFISWGYPAARGGTLCSFEGALQTTANGQLIVKAFVEEGVSGGPLFVVDPEDKASKLAGIVVSGDGDVTSGTTNAIDIRQAVAVVATARDRRNGNRPHIWPNIPLPSEIVVDALRSFQKVDAGTFLMGGDRTGDERWPGAGSSGGSLALPVFFIGQYEVTATQYRECVSAGACTAAALGGAGTDGDLPVVGINWSSAVTYAHWLQRRLAARVETPRLLRRLFEAGWQLDLPSEAEWEKAARKNGKDAFPWGNSPQPAFANYNTGRLRAVSSSRCDDCAYRLFDMAGNAREWTRSLKLPYPYSAQAEDPTAPGNRAVRGGSFKKEENAVFAAQIVRAANRQDAPPSSFDQYTGFRLALICIKERGCNWVEPD